MRAYGFKRAAETTALLLGFLPVVVALAAEPESPAAEPVLRAGAATSNITPPIGLDVVGGWKPSPSTHVHDELHARCLVLDNGERRLALVVCDNLGIPRDVLDEAKRRVNDALGLPVDHVLAAATHTHSAVSAYGPNRLKRADSFNDYQEFLIVRIVDAVRTAVHRLEPAQLGWGSANEPTQVFNRRWLMKPGEHLRNPFGGHDQVRMNPPRRSGDLIKPAGPTDPEIPFITVRAVDGRPIALLANYSLHYVGGVDRGAISADYFAVFADRIQELLDADRLDPPFVGIMTNGTSGDINNIDFQAAPPKVARYEKMRQVAHLVAEKVFQAHAGVEFHDWVALGAAQRELTLATRKPTEQQMAWSADLLVRSEEPKDSLEHRQRVYARRFARLAEAPDEIEIVLQTIRIGEVGIATIPFETFAEIGLEIKSKSPLSRTFVVSFGNGSYGYLPTPRHFELGGYETWMGTNNVEEQAATKIVASLLEMLAELR
jgi:hypothetical protein